jgi:mannose-6-phosphate isomerase-like protein (cupin superfamily)|tara:strand:+ start:487 stop:819 length:333 start_codon:yes stop_codon:yes gene_type:complete
VKLKRSDIDGQVVKRSDVYTVIDNTQLKNLVVSKTILHPLQSTSGHSHEGQEEVYQFVAGYGEMIVGTDQFAVISGDVILIPDGKFHQVSNTNAYEDLVFVCVFDGTRRH